jgi:hypothetical protein
MTRQHFAYFTEDRLLTFRQDCVFKEAEMLYREQKEEWKRSFGIGFLAEIAAIRASEERLELEIFY